MSTRLAIWLHRKWTGHHTLTYPIRTGASVHCQGCSREWAI